MTWQACCDYPNCTAKTDITTPFPECKSCMGGTCPDHQIPGTLTEADLDQPAKCYCLDCKDFVEAR